MDIKKIANILYNMSLGLGYAESLEYMQYEIKCIEDGLHLLKENQCDSLIETLEVIAMDNIAQENLFQTKG